MTKFGTGASRRRWRLATVLLAGAVFAAACGSSDDDGGGGTAATEAPAGSEAPAASDNSATTAPSGSDTSASGSSDEGAAAGDADPEGSLTVAWQLALNTLDPLQNTNVQNVAYNLPVYDTLIFRTNKGELEPGLAKSWEWSEDGKSFVLELQEGVKFQDDTDLTADVVKANLDRLIEVETSPVKSAVANVESVEATGPLEVTIHMTAPDASLPFQLADRPGMMVSGKAIADGVDLSTNAIGAGPYKVVEFVASERIVYERFDGYWGDKSRQTAKRIELIGIPDGQARLNGVLSGEFDAAYITPSQASQAESADGLHLETNSSLWYIQTYLNRSKSEALNNKLVRQAMVHALDRNAMCEAIYFGYCEVTSQPFLPDHWAGTPDMKEPYFDYDPDKARELLKEAGYPDGFSFELMIPAASDPYPQLAELMQAQWAEVGITANINPVDISQLATKYMGEGVSDALVGGGGQVAEPTMWAAGQLASTAFANPGGLTAPGVDDLINKMRTTLDQDARGDVVRELTQVIVDDVQNIIMYRPQIIYAVRDNVVGWQQNFVANYPIVIGVGVTGD